MLIVAELGFLRQKARLQGWQQRLGILGKAMFAQRCVTTGVTTRAYP